MYDGTIRDRVFSSGREVTPYPQNRTDAGRRVVRPESRKKQVHIMPCIIPQTHATDTRCRKQTKVERYLSAEFLDIGLLALEGQRHDTADVHLGAVDVHVQAELGTHGLDVLETLLV